MSEKLKIILPTSWNEISIGQYINISKVDKTSDIEFITELLLILCDNLTKDIVENINADYLLTISQTLEWMRNSPDVETIEKEFKIGNDVYRYERDFNKFTFGEMVSYETLLESGQFSERESILLVLSIILRKVENGKLENFNSDLINERVELFRDNLMIGDTLGLVFFFKNGGKRPSIIIEDYLKELREMTMKN